MKNNGEEKFLVMCAADENKKAAENKIYKLSGFREQKLFYIFYSHLKLAIFSTRKSLPLSIGGSISVNSLEPEVPFAVFHLCNISFSFIFN